MTKQKRGLLAMHYGTPATLGDVLPYYTHIRRGRPPSPEQLADLIARYESIGGPSPLSEISRRQAEAIGSGLTKHGVEVSVYMGAKHAQPFVADAVTQMAQDGVTQAVGVVLAPHYSSFSVAQYKAYGEEARARVAPDMEIAVLDRWGTLPALIDALAERVKETLAGLDNEKTVVLFTAHSLPLRAVAEGDPYQKELFETSRLVAERAGVPRWRFAYQSASATGEPWLGPDVLEVIEEEKAKGEVEGVVACTVGFVSDHLEVLYDLGIEARQKCAELGLGFRLARTINDDPAVMDALAGELASLFG